MRSCITGRVLSLLSIAVIALLLLTPRLGVHIASAIAQDKPSSTAAMDKVVLTTVPSPAQKGNNTVRVKLTDPTGKPISGAEVTVTFFMAAMPAMNMPEMRTVIKGADKGAGIYEGKSDLGSAGMWEVTITAQQNGHTIAAKKLTVKATGGA
jgi:nitrogen fixation protein FixH